MELAAIADETTEAPVTDDSDWSDEWTDEWALDDTVAEADSTLATDDHEPSFEEPADELAMVDESVEPEANHEPDAHDHVLAHPESEATDEMAAADEGTTDGAQSDTDTDAVDFALAEAEAHARLDAIFGALEPATTSQDEEHDESFAVTDPWGQTDPQVSDEFPAPTPDDSSSNAADPAEMDHAAMAPIGPAIQEVGAPESTEVMSTGDPSVAQTTTEPTADLSDIEVEVRGSLAGEAPRRKYSGVLARVGDDSMWRHKSVPKRKTDSKTMVLTPNVGPVRVIFDGGESIDGRLHSVGQNKIVLDTKMGRMTLDARRADRIDRLTNSTRSLRSPATTGSTSGLDRVRVRTKGGTFYGHLVSRDGDKLTLLLDEGFRITLESDDVAPMAGKKSVGSRLRRLDK